MKSNIKDLGIYRFKITFYRTYWNNSIQSREKFKFNEMDSTIFQWHKGMWSALLWSCKEPECAGVIWKSERNVSDNIEAIQISFFLSWLKWKFKTIFDLALHSIRNMLRILKLIVRRLIWDIKLFNEVLQGKIGFINLIKIMVPVDKSWNDLNIYLDQSSDVQKILTNCLISLT